MVWVLLVELLLHLFGSSRILLGRLLGSTKSEKTHKSNDGFILILFFFSYYVFILCQWYRRPKAGSFLLFLIHHTRFESHILSDAEVIISRSVNSFVKWPTSLITNCCELLVPLFVAWAFQLVMELWAWLIFLTRRWLYITIKRLVVGISWSIKLKDLRLDVLFNLGYLKLESLLALTTTWSILRREVITTRCFFSIILRLGRLWLNEGVSSLHPTMLLLKYIMFLLAYYFKGLFVWAHQFGVTWLTDPLVDKLHTLMHLLVISVRPLNNTINIFFNLLARFQ